MARDPRGDDARGDEAHDVVEGEVDRVTYENAQTGFRVLRVTDRQGKRITVVGKMQAISAGARIRATGRFGIDPKFGSQLRAVTVLPLVPDTLQGIEKLLGSGLAEGIGPAYAQRIVARFGEETSSVLDNHPERLAEVPGLGPKRAQALASAWAEQKVAREVMIFLHAQHVSPGLAQRITKRYGANTIRLLRENPYRLATEVWGVGFKTADEIARSLGIAKDAPERIRAAVLHVLDQLQERGHVFVPRPLLASEAVRTVDVDPLLVEGAIDEVCAGEHAVAERIDEHGPVVYAARLHSAELQLAASVSALCDRKVKQLSGARQAIEAFEHRTGTTLAPAQRAAVEQAATCGVLVITGGPGVGKTTLVRAVLELFSRGRLAVRLAAPTGRAARRMEEATQHEAQTIHRLLEFDPKQGGFSRDDANPLELDALVVDECSMLDLPLARSLLAALPQHARLVLVGDVDQLPSIGPGAVLRDVIESGRVPTIRLTEIFRQAAKSLIVENAHRILDGRAPGSSPKGDPQGDFFLSSAVDPADAAEKVRQLVVERIPKTFGLDPVRQVQVLTPMHRGPAGSQALNQILQASLNPPRADSTTGLFRAGDKVMQLRNDYQRDVFNGDIGFVTAVEAEGRKVTVDVDGRAVIYEDSQLDELTLAYACSIHKSQGSEYPAVVIPMLSSHFVMLSRNLLYTAVTRGKRLVVLITDKHALRVALDETRREERYTWLAQRIREQARPAL